MTNEDAVNYVTRRVMRRWLIWLFLIFMLVSVLFAYRGQLRDAVIEANTRDIHATVLGVDKNTAALKVAVHEQCLVQNQTAVTTNGIVDSIVDSVMATKSLPESEKAARLKIVVKLTKVPIIVCNP